MLDEQPVETTLYSLTTSPPPEPDQRRSSERHLSLLRVGSLMIGERRELCLIRNISAGGMMIRAYSKIEAGTRLSIELREGEPIRGVAQWAKDDSVGISFETPIDVIGLISNSDNGPRPRMPRIEVNRTAWVREDATVHRARTMDISQGGIKIASATEILVGADVIVALNGLAPIPAIVRWQEADMYGITFNRALGLPMLVSWLQNQQPREASRAAG